jgi:hypothetical protein
MARLLDVEPDEVAFFSFVVAIALRQPPTRGGVRNAIRALDRLAEIVARDGAKGAN